MRASLADSVRRHKEWGGWGKSLGSWWVEWPCRRRLFWRTLLLEPGQGWLRWKRHHFTTIVGFDPGEPEDRLFVPPLRRVAEYLWSWVRWPWLVLHGYGWNEARPSWSDHNWPNWGVNPDRKREVWSVW